MSSKRNVEFDIPVSSISGKPGKNAKGYFRMHYGKKRWVSTDEYVDHPTENQLQSREAFAALRRQASQEIHDPVLGPLWQAKFNEEKKRLKEKFTYFTLHGFVYARLKAGESVQA